MRLTQRDMRGIPFCQDVSYLEMLDKLADYEDAEERNLLIHLPCKIGDTVFVVEGGSHSIYKSRVSSITLNDKGLWLDGTYNHFGLVYFSGEIGRNVFLTREEAETARQTLC